MTSLATKILRFLKAEEGPTAVEYAAIVMLIFLVCISVITVVGQSTQQSFEESNDSISSALQQRP